MLCLFLLSGPDFCYYDFQEPAKLVSAYPDSALGGALRKGFDAVIADPPYLNEDCMSKTGETVRLLAKSSACPVMFNTGAVLRKPMRLLLNCRPCVTRPKHRVQIMNPFLTYTNFDAKSLGGWEEDE